MEWKIGKNVLLRFSTRAPLYPAFLVLSNDPLPSAVIGLNESGSEKNRLRCLKRPVTAKEQVMRLQVIKRQLPNVAVSLANSVAVGVFDPQPTSCFMPAKLIYQSPPRLWILLKKPVVPMARLCRQISKAGTFQGTGTFPLEGALTAAAASRELFVSQDRQAESYC